MVKKIWYTYDDIHKVVKQVAEKVQNSGVKYDAMIAIGGGGFNPRPECCALFLTSPSTP